MTEPAAEIAAAAWLPVAELRPWAKNPRRNDPAVPRVMVSIQRFGFVAPIVIWRSAGRMVAGHTRLKALQQLLAADPAFTPKGAPGPGMARVVFHEFRDENEADAYALADNRLGELAEWDQPVLDEILGRLGEEERYAAGFDEGPKPQTGDGAEGARATLAERFGVPPFSVLDARQGYWQERKRAWLGLGIRSELGRGEALIPNGGGQHLRPGTMAEPSRAEPSRAEPSRAPDVEHRLQVRAAPGGSLMPAMDYRSRQRGDGKGRAL